MKGSHSRAAIHASSRSASNEAQVGALPPVPLVVVLVVVPELVVEVVPLLVLVAPPVPDEELLGGVIVEIEGRVYDGSVRTRLARLAARMSGD